MAVSLELAISAIRAGRKEEGRQLLNLLIQQNPNNEMAWLWMSSVVNTDEQRARCLYHVLSINPNSKLAQRGLQVLGIVVSDSRPVRIPRDSQPIHIPKPTEPPPEQNSSTNNRRPFLIDPNTVTRELPFMPVKPPFQQPKIQASREILAIRVDDSDASAEETAAKSGQPTPPAHPNAAPKPDTAPSASSSGQMNAPANAGPAKPQPQSAAPEPHAKPDASNKKVDAPQPKPDAGEEVDYVVVYPSMETQALALTEAQQEALAKLEAEKRPETEAAPPQPVEESPQATPAPAPPSPAVASAQTQMMPSLEGDTSEPSPEASSSREVKAADADKQPSPPAPGPDANSSPPPPQKSNSQPVQPPQPASQPPPNGGFSQPSSPPPQPGSQASPPFETRPSQPVFVNYPDPNATGQMGYYFNQQPVGHPSQPFPQNPDGPFGGMHSASTMGMPPPQGQYYRPPSEPVPVIQTSMGLVPYAGQYPFHSNATILMPTMSEAEARARLSNSHAIPTASAAAMPLQNMNGWPGMAANGQPVFETDDEAEPADDRDEINILAVIIFGTLSITAFGGLGMLLLLIFTTPA